IHDDGQGQPPLPRSNVGVSRPGRCSPSPSQVGSGTSAVPEGPFPVPATSNGACGFPALRFPVCFAPRVIRLSRGARFQSWIRTTDPVCIEESEPTVQPGFTPLAPSETSLFPGAHQMSPHLLFDPVFHKREASAGMPDGKVIDPAP